MGVVFDTDSLKPNQSKSQSSLEKCRIQSFLKSCGGPLGLGGKKVIGQLKYGPQGWWHSGPGRGQLRLLSAFSTIATIH